MAWLIMNDAVDYPCEWYPCYVIGAKEELIPLFLGASTAINMPKAVGLYVRENDYKKLNHKKAYIFVHNPDAVEEDINDIDWDQIPDVTEKLSAQREHIHLWLDTDVIIEEVKGDDQ